MVDDDEKERRAVLAELRAITRRMDAAKGLIDRRRELMHRGRDLRITGRELGEACGVTESAVLKELGRPYTPTDSP